MSSVSVLMYHAIESVGYPAGSMNAGEQCYVVKEEKFREQMEYLYREGFRVFLFEELLDLEKIPDKVVILTFDDGHESNFVLALPCLQQYGFKAEFFITTDWIGKTRYMDTEQVKALHDAGMGIGSHGLSHKFLDDMNKRTIKRELQESMEVLSMIIGRKIVTFSAPGGRMRRNVSVIAEDIGYRIVCVSQPGLLCQKSSLFSIPRFAVRADTDLTTFKSMVLGDKEYVNKLVRRNNILSFAKKVLGNKLYEMLRKTILRK